MYVCIQPYIVVSEYMSMCITFMYHQELSNSKGIFLWGIIVTTGIFLFVFLIITSDVLLSELANMNMNVFMTVSSNYQ